MPTITIVGLGPGDPNLLTRGAWELLQSIPEIYLRTRHHPAVDAFPATVEIQSFDALYDSASDYVSLYAGIAEQLVALAVEKDDAGVVYGVPGDPAIGEATTWLIRERAAARGIRVRILNGISFLEPACLALGIDPLARDGLQVLDALVVAANHAPPFDPSRPALLAQCYSRAVASDVKLTLMHSFGPEHPVTVLQSAGLRSQRLHSLSLYELDRQTSFDHLTTVYVPPAGPHASYNRLQEIVARLRAPDGCPWDREQTLQSLRRDVMEEVYELLEALDGEDDEKLREELGDTALLIAMLAQIAGEEERFLWPGVMEQVSEKLIRRHPHVFADTVVESTEDVLANWARIKEEERRAANVGRTVSPLTSIPTALPALALARKCQSRLERAGIEPHLPDDNPIGLALWELVARARAEGADAETALRELCRAVIDDRLSRGLEHRPD